MDISHLTDLADSRPSQSFSPGAEFLLSFALKWTDDTGAKHVHQYTHRAVVTGTSETASLQYRVIGLDSEQGAPPWSRMGETDGMTGAIAAFAVPLYVAHSKLVWL